jgi:putative DNA primase/helicase
VAAELSEGKRLNESMVKDLTGGDIIAARYLHKEFFEFKPNFKIWMYGNHKPVIKGTDEGIWRRIKLIEFKVVIPENERDPNLLEKLKGELTGILAWAVRGCLAWQREGLRTPASVDAATAAYRAEQDTLAAFLEECCTTESYARVTAGTLFDAYEKWGGELNKRRFSQAMAECGFVTKGRDGAGRALYHGLGLLEPENVQND